MKPSEFRVAWTSTEQNLQPITLHTLSRFELDEETIDFLFESGLPSDAAPFLSFVGDVHLNNKYSTISFLTEWFNFLEPEYRKYVVIGSDNGDVIAIDTTNNFIIESLNHDDYFSATFMNSSVVQLANCLLCYRDFVQAVNADKTGEGGYDTEFTDGQFDTFRDSLENIDQRAVREGFWNGQLEILLANRADTRNKR